ncbi:MAG: protein-disulfide reductase DsbD domain-containing protein [Tepidisphaeraceae bacterium]
MRWACFIFGLMTCATLARAEAVDATQDSAKPKVRVELLANVSAVQPGHPFTVALHFRIAPGWHLYWKNPGDTGAPPKARWTLPAGATAGELQFPVPQRIAAGEGLTAFGYEDDVTLLAVITPGKTIDQKLSLAARVSWVVCRDVCLSEHQDVSLELPVGHERPANSEQFIDSVSRQPLRDADAAQREMSVRIDPTNLSRGEIDFNLKPGETPVDFFPPAADFAVYQKPQLDRTGGAGVYRLPFTLLPGSHDDFTGTGLVVLTDSAGKRIGYELPCAFHFPK